MRRPLGISARHLIVPFLLAATLLLFGRTKNFSFVSFDDADYVYDNIQVRQGLTAEGIRWAFAGFHAFNWHPLTWISHMLDVSLFGMKPSGHHLVGVALHGVNAVLLYLLLLSTTGATWRSAFAAALFAVHPLHVESVAWVAERKDLLCAFFSVLTMLAYRRYCLRPGWGWYAAVVALFLMALLAKPMAVTLPFVLLLLDYWPLDRWGEGHPGPRRNLVMEKVPLILCSVAACAITIAAQRSGGAVVSIENIPFGWRIANALSAYSTYLGQTFWPSSLCVFYPHPGSGLSPWRIVASVLLLGILSLVALRERRRHPWFLAGWLWYLGMLIPVIGLIQVGAQARADRYTYLPLVGIFLIAAWGVETLSRRWPIPRLAIGVAAIAALVAFAGTAWVQVGTWENSHTLYGRALKVTERNWLAHHNLGLVLLDEGKSVEALERFREALGIHPQYAEARYNAAVTLGSLGRTNEAIVEYREVIRLDPRRLEAYNNLAELLARQGNLREAIPLLREAVRLGPASAVARHNLGLALMQEGSLDEAISSFREALRLSPSNDKTRRLLDEALSLRGRNQRATPRNVGGS
jgi:tetratricopeptide (TPR) repeat protein